MKKFKVFLILFIALCVAFPSYCFAADEQNQSAPEKTKKVKKAKKERPHTQFDNTEQGEPDEELPEN